MLGYEGIPGYEGMSGVRGDAGVRGTKVEYEVISTGNEDINFNFTLYIRL